MAIEKVLIVDPQPCHLQPLEEALKGKKSEVFLASCLEEAVPLLDTQVFDLVICDVTLDFLQRVKEKRKETLVVLTTTMGQIQSAIEAMRFGAFSYLVKPLSLEGIEPLLAQIQEHIDLLQENNYLREEISGHPHSKTHLLIAQSEMMKKILSDVSKIAKSSASVFISGESGTGKEVIAHAIHFASNRSLQPFIKVNCAAIPATLLESEFFGHEKGAFTGAMHKKPGRFELADKGTLLLDEVSEIPLELQAKLLRVVQEMEFERIGGVRPIHVDVRLIATSNRCMKTAVEQKQFREDLYYRLNVVPLQLPPLRERKADILPLAEFFLKSFCKENQKPLKELTASAQQKLLEYHWPGNIRELANVMERTVVMNVDRVILSEQVYIDLSCPVRSVPLEPCTSSGITLAAMEKKMILETLARENNNRTKTAAALGISVRTLRNKLHLYQS